MSTSLHTVPSRSRRETRSIENNDSRRHPIAWAHWLFLTVTFVMLATPNGGDRTDPIGNIGWYVHSSFKSWSGIGFVMTPPEVALSICLFGWFIYRYTSRHPISYWAGTLILPVLVFAGFLLIGVINGVYIKHGIFNIALWEVRGFLMAVVVYLLVGIYIRTQKQANTLLWTILLASTFLAIDDFLRWALLYNGHIPSDDAYDHTDSLPIMFTLVLCVSVWLFKGTVKQRVVALILIPFLLTTSAVMERRAAFAVLFAGLIVVMLVLLRIRPRLFAMIGLPLCLAVGVYLAAFWHSESTLGQPARAVSSMFSPDPRDASSNLYRDLEKLDIRYNIQANEAFGLGFGQQFIFYVALPNLSFWPFWHYTTHNADLWVWMKDGAGGYAAFLWVFGQALHDGSVLLETQREEWDVLARLGISGRHKPGASRTNTPGRHASPSRAHNATAETTANASASASTLDDLSGRQSPDAHTAPTARQLPHVRTPLLRDSQGVLPLLITCVAYVMMQIIFSYVDLGLTSDRAMFLLAIAIGLIARGDKLLGVELPPMSTARGLLRSRRDKRATSRKGSSRPRTEAEVAARVASLKAQADRQQRQTADTRSSR